MVELALGLVPTVEISNSCIFIHEILQINKISEVFIIEIVIFVTKTKTFLFY